MDDAGLVDGGEALGDLAADVTAQFLGHPLQLVEQVTERLALDVLHDEVVLLDAVLQRRVAVMGADDVVVLDLSADPGLAEEPLEEARRLEQVRVDHLQRDGRAGRQPGCLHHDLGTVDLAHAPGAELGEDLIAAEECAFHGAQSNRDGVSAQGE